MHLLFICLDALNAVDAERFHKSSRQTAVQDFFSVFTLQKKTVSANMVLIHMNSDQFWLFFI